MGLAAGRSAPLLLAIVKERKKSFPPMPVRLAAQLPRVYAALLVGCEHCRHIRGPMRKCRSAVLLLVMLSLPGAARKQKPA